MCFFNKNIPARYLRRFINIYHPSIPVFPVQVPSSDFALDLQIDRGTLSKVEQVSLLKCRDKQDRDRLVEAVKLGSLLLDVDTCSVKPLVYINETGNCPLRDDVPFLKPDIKGKLLRLADDVREDYYVVPQKEQGS